MLSDAEQAELLQRVRQLEVKVDAYHKVGERHRIELRDTLASLIRRRSDDAVTHRIEMRDTLAALTRRLFGVDPVTRNDDAPFWKLTASDPEPRPKGS